MFQYWFSDIGVGEIHRNQMPMFEKRIYLNGQIPFESPYRSNTIRYGRAYFSRDTSKLLVRKIVYITKDLRRRFPEQFRKFIYNENRLEMLLAWI